VSQGGGEPDKFASMGLFDFFKKKSSFIEEGNEELRMITAQESIEKIIWFANDFFTKNATMNQVITESQYVYLHNDITEVALEQALIASPQVTDAWLKWSEFKPVSDTWRFYENEDGSFQVWHSSYKRDDDILNTVNKFEACAAFIKREMETFRSLD
jgi:hypothetical protein